MNPIKDRPTPETDAAFLKLYAGYLTHPATIDLQAAEKFARTLERQKAALREALEEAVIVIERSRRNLSNHGFDHTSHLFQTIEKATNQARAALAATKPTQ